MNAILQVLEKIFIIRTDHRDSIIVRENSAPPVGVLHSGVAHLAKSYLEVIPGVYARMSTLKLHANE